MVRLSDWLSLRGVRARHAVAPQPREVAVRKVLTPPGLLLGGRQPPHGVGRKRPAVTGGEPKPTSHAKADSLRAPLTETSDLRRDEPTT